MRRYLTAISTFAALTFAALATGVDEHLVSAEITAPGFSGTTTITNFPLLVKISANQPVGFTYAAVESGDDIHFYDESGTALAADCDTWDVTGESIFWVKVPKFSKTSKVTMCWGAAEGATPVVPAAGETWSDYKGVWHMSEAKESTTNAAATAFGPKRLSVDGVVGGASGATVTGKNGPLVVSTGNAALDALTTNPQYQHVTFTGWLYLNSATTDWPYLFSRKTEDASTGYGLQIVSTNTQIRHRLNGSGYYTDNVTISAGEWHFIEVDYYYHTSSDKCVNFYLDGVKKINARSLGSSSIQPTQTYDFSIGGLVGTTGYGTLNGNMDEFRARVGYLSADWRTNDLAQYTNTAYTVFGEIAVNAAANAANTNTFWAVTPGLDSVSWDVGGTAAEVRTGSAYVGGAPATISVVYRNQLTGEETTTMPTGRGVYEAVFTIDGTDVSETVEFEITHESSYAQTQSDRVLVFSYDHTVDGANIEEPQYYSNINTNNAVFWKRLNTIANGNKTVLPQLQAGYQFEMWTKQYGSKLWQLDYCRLGNAFLNAVDASSMASTQNYLPVSSKSGRFNNASLTSYATQNRYSAALAMLNTTNSCVYSSCYEEGIGTIYFDAVNGFIAKENELAIDICTSVYAATGDAESGMRLNDLGEIATDEDGNALAPTDENCFFVDGDGVTNNYGRCKWEPLESYYRYVIKSGVVDEALSGEATTMLLDCTDGGTTGNFFRFRTQPLNYRGPIRFRIRRVGRADNTEASPGYNTTYLDGAGLVLLDNIIVSYPAMSVKVSQYGSYEPGETGKENQGATALGQRGAFSIAFPSCTDEEIYGRAYVDYSGLTNSATAIDLDAAGGTGFISKFAMKYRWRYLDQELGEWQTTYLTRGDDATDWVSASPLKFVDSTGAAVSSVGDIEYKLSAELDAPYYEFCDYTGLGLKFSDDFSERITKVDVTADAISSLVGETDEENTTYVRLREGSSQYEIVRGYIRTADSYYEPFDFELIGDHQWRGFYSLTNETSTSATLWFEGLYPQVNGAKVYNREDDNVTSWGFASGTSITVSGTINLTVTEDGRPASIELPLNTTGYLMFVLNENTGALQIGLADRQTFDNWASARSGTGTIDFFRSSARETNSTSRTAIRYPTSLSTNVVDSFTETVAERDSWKENFAISSGQTTAGYPQNVFFGNENKSTPNNWTANYFYYVPQTFGLSGDNITDFAMELVGGVAQGSVEFTSTSSRKAPNGLDYVSLQTRLAQKHDFTNVSYCWNSFGTEYTLACQAAFDESTSFAGFDGEASVSLFAGYVPYVGGYEYRVTMYNDGQQDKDKVARCKYELIEWSYNGSAYEAKVLAATTGVPADCGNTNETKWYWSGKTKANAVQLLPLGKNGVLYSGMFLSFKVLSNGSVVLVGGVTGDTGNKLAASPTAFSASSSGYSDKTFWQIGVTNLTPVTRVGMYGITSRNCPASIKNPVSYSTAVGFADTGVNSLGSDGSYYDAGTGGYYWAGKVGWATGLGDVSSEYTNITRSRWFLSPERITTNGVQTASNYGFASITNASQSVKVQVLPLNSSGVATTNEWTTLTNITVNSFNLATTKAKLESPDSCNVKIICGDGANDVVVDSISMAQWCGESGSSEGASSSYGYYYDFYYSGAWISNATWKIGTTTHKQKVALLAPRRSDGVTPIQLRTPFLEGLGSYSINWRDADSNAVLEVQRWVGSFNYLNGHIADKSTDSDWTTIESIDFGTMTAAERKEGNHTTYLGMRAPSNGVFRVIVPEAKVTEALAHKEYDPNWGAVTITDAWCYNEPKFDSRSWWGWNFLTTGWTDEGKSGIYSSLEDGGRGAAAILNNSVTTDLEDGYTNNDYNENNPFIQSPTFPELSDGENIIGEVSFKAKAYTANGVDFLPCYVTVWGATDGEKQAAEDWTAVTNILVDSKFYQRHTVKCNDTLRFAAIRLGVANVDGILSNFKMSAADLADLTGKAGVRVVIDDVVLTQRINPEIGFRVGYTRPFRLGLKDMTAVLDIASHDEQPLLGEQFGVQSEIEVVGMSEEIDLDKTPEVYLSYFVGDEPWGYDNWKDNAKAVIDVKLDAAEGTNLVYRSTSNDMKSFISPIKVESGVSYETVQYFLKVKYWDKAGGEHEGQITSKQWKMPDWYEGYTDPNESSSSFSPFTLLDNVSPGRAWINEVNWTDAEGTAGTKQFIEICFPAGYDMTGWQLYSLDLWGSKNLLAKLGATSGLEKLTTKQATGGDPNFAFLALAAPGSSVAEADGTWSKDFTTLTPTWSYGFMLQRPSGVVEDRIVLQGFTGSSRYSKNQTATNLVATLESLWGGDWVWVGDDTNTVNAAGLETSAGVFQNAGQTMADWNHDMKLTPGALNENQTIPADWFIAPSGDNVWLSITTLGGDIWFVGDEGRVTATTIVIPLGNTTNLVFETSNWYMLGELMRSGTDVTADAVKESRGKFVYTFSEETANSVNVQAKAAIDTEVTVKGGLDPNDPYAPAVMNWLKGGMANGELFESDEISTNSFFQGLSKNDARIPLSLKDRYWLDIDPTSDAWDLRGGMGEGANLNASTPTMPAAQAQVREGGDYAQWPDTVTNRIVTVTMMISNKVDNSLSRAPNRLQGLGGEKSDEVGAKNWTSETFKVELALLKTSTSATSWDVSQNYYPMAFFVFDTGSFMRADEEHPYSARIEVMDPFSTGSPAYGLGWAKYGDSNFGYRWNLNASNYLRSPDTLKKVNTWDGNW